MTRAWPSLRRSSPARRGCSAAASIAGAAPAAALLCSALLCALLGAAAPAAAQVPATIERVKASVVGVGTFQKTRAPPFRFLGTGFAVGDGATIVTNAHVLPQVLEADKGEAIAIIVPGPGREAQLRTATRGASDPQRDLALLRIPGPALPALAIRDSETVREGESVLFTGYPIGAVLGPFPATHRGMVSAITPIAIPAAHSSELKPELIRRLSSGPFPVFQLDATAYPGNSGSPVYDPATGEVIGVVNMVFVKGTKESALERPSGITYAIPSRYLVDLLRAKTPPQ
jgi:S1-C subfamily serine protease